MQEETRARERMNSSDMTLLETGGVVGSNSKSINNSPDNGDVQDDVVKDAPVGIYGSWAIYLIIQVNSKSLLMEEEFSLTWEVEGMLLN
jgi:hypothetical protein